MLWMCSIASETSVNTVAARIDSFSAGASEGKSATLSDSPLVSGLSFRPLRRQITKEAATIRNQNLIPSRTYFLEQHESGQTFRYLICQARGKKMRDLIRHCLERDQRCAIWDSRMPLILARHPV
jgi:hypothetical protein